MKAVTIREAKAHLNELIQAAARGEQVVLMRGSKHVAAIVPLSADELELPSRLSDPQAERFWHQLAEGRRGESRLLFESPGRPHSGTTTFTFPTAGPTESGVVPHPSPSTWTSTS